MRGHEQLEIYSKRGSETEWTLLTVDTNNPYLEGRAPVGDLADDVSVTAQA